MVPVAEIIVFEGLFDMHIEASSDLETGQVVSSNCQDNGNGMEVYTAYGRDLRNPL